MNYQETIDYILNSLPMFQRIGAAAYKNNLDNTQQLMHALGNPHQKLKCIHVAGTNGKGSTSHLLASILQEHGLRVGLHTSPHLRDFRERIRINGKMIEEQNVINFIATYKPLIEEIKPSFFEMAVGMAFDYFASENIDIAIIEVGMGGRLDSTNVITPILSVITNIGLDHVQFLGSTLREIAVEKAGIIKSDVPVVIGETHLETAPIFKEKAIEEHATITFADEHFASTNVLFDKEWIKMDIMREGKPYLHNIISPLAGEYQLKNIATVCAAIYELTKKGFAITPDTIKRGIANVISNTHLMGRWQLLQRNPLTICDTGHNEDGMCYVLQQISHTKYKKLHFVLGMVNDKDVNKVLKMLPKDAEYYLCKANIPRGMEVKELSEKVAACGLVFTSYDSVAMALQSAQQKAENDDLVFIGGSTFTVAECF